MKKLVLAVALVAALTGCTRPDQARRLLTQQGYTQIEITGYAPFACSKDDTFHTEFRAVSAAGHQVQGVVCSALLKGATIRLED
ncbi:hypothetical protein H1O16_gp345 [Burkholderia phage BcepSaruman]|uniref:Lipoprotein n=1 Tax=Burkholderia phage BcepSaruman TaxID=2530032 RepID=A0A4D5ZI64_9CAUD|nr:hypothetical protein H1O16_gp345 [Burkholderia phage BcepSaruman]QBX06758.1 hypothetical protein BcepSaruman_345 [Burkholderia phage BcepSaruman]